jgi:hypothetical protein
MHELRHYPTVSTEGQFECVDCSTPLPPDAAKVALETAGAVVEIPSVSAFYPALPDDVKAAVSCQREGARDRKDPIYFEAHEGCRGAGCAECDNRGVVARVLQDDGSYSTEMIESAPTRDPDVVLLPKKTEMEKMVSRVAWNNFLQMREMTRLQEPEEVVE